MVNERRNKPRIYDGKIAADLPSLPLRLNATGIVIVASRINKLARSMRFIADGYDGATKAEQEYSEEKITRAVTTIGELWNNLRNSKEVNQ